MNDHLKPAFGDRVGDWHRWFAWHPVDTAEYDVGDGLWVSGDTALLPFKCHHCGEQVRAGGHCGCPVSASLSSGDTTP